MNSIISGRNTQDTNNRNNSVTFQGGQNLGACASGFGTCCLISVSQCDSVITENSTVTVVFINTNSIYFDDKKKEHLNLRDFFIPVCEKPWISGNVRWIKCL